MATFLVTLLGAGVVNGIIAARRHTYINAQRVEAFGLAKSKIEEMKGKKFDTLSANYGNEQVETDLVFVNLGGEKQKTITARRILKQVDVPNPTRKRVTVTIEWDYRGSSKQEEITTFLYPRR